MPGQTRALPGPTAASATTDCAPRWLSAPKTRSGQETGLLHQPDLPMQYLRHGASKPPRKPLRARPAGPRRALHHRGAAVPEASVTAPNGSARPGPVYPTNMSPPLPTPECGHGRPLPSTATLPEVVSSARRPSAGTGQACTNRSLRERAAGPARLASFNTDCVAARPASTAAATRKAARG